MKKFQDIRGFNGISESDIPKQTVDEALSKKDIKKALQKVKGLSDKQLSLISTLPMPVITNIVNQLSTIVASNDPLEEKLVAGDLSILDAILGKIKDDVIDDKVKGNFEKSWPKMQALAKIAGYGITKKMQAKGKAYMWKLRK
jgi:hypothetical protein